MFDEVFMENRNDNDHIRTIENDFLMVRNFIQQQKLKQTGATKA